jgi:hypothetical protein
LPRDREPLRLTPPLTRGWPRKWHWQDRHRTENHPPEVKLRN